MPVPIARRNLFEGKVRFIMSVSGVALAILLILILDGIFAGSMKQVTAYMDNTPFDIIVSQKGVKNLHMTTSFFYAGELEKIQKIKGVDTVSPILYSTDYLVKGNNRSIAYLIGFKPGKLGGPWAMAEGTMDIKPGEIIIDKQIADKYDMKEGDKITTAGRSFKISGLTKGTVNIINSIAFIRFDDFEKIRNLQNIASYGLVEVKPGEDKSEVVSRIERTVGKVTVMEREEFSASERKVVSDMSVDIMRLMNLIAFFIGLAALGLTIYTATLSKLKDYGILKALGIKNRKLMEIVFGQAVMSIVIGYIISLAIAFLIVAGLGLVRSNILIVVTLQSMYKIFVGAAVISLVASSIPILRIAGIDPQEVFRR